MPSSPQPGTRSVAAVVVAVVASLALPVAGFYLFVWGMLGTDLREPTTATAELGANAAKLAAVAGVTVGLLMAWLPHRRPRLRWIGAGFAIMLIGLLVMALTW